MRTRLRLFLEWGITFEEPYIVPERADRAVAYKDESVSADELLTIAQRNHSIAEGEIAEIRGCAV